MRGRRKMKTWKTALIIVPIALVVCVGLFFLLCGTPGEPDRHDIVGCGQEPKPIVSAELVSQEKPLVFFQLMEEPKIEGIKVKLTYEDGSSEVVDAYDMETCTFNYEWSSGDAGMHHLKGMCFNTRFTTWNRIRPALKPGKHQIALFYVDDTYPWSTDLIEDPAFDSLNPEDVGVAYCMVEVYAQTGDEYIAAHKAKYTLVTESKDGKLKTHMGTDGLDSYGLVKLLAKGSGTFEIKIGDGGNLIESYCGSGEYKYVFDSADLTENSYVKLNANEPMFLRAWTYSSIGGPALNVSMTRVPDDTIAFD